jgi:putative ABC transport system ATP-binding protein
MTAALVELEKIEKVYGTKEASLTVLKDVDLSIQEGEFVGIVGASGSGKTTLMNILGCLDRPTRGRYLLSGRDISAMSDDKLSSIRNLKIGFVFQSFNLIPELTVLENVEVPLFYMKMPKRRRKGKCLELLEAVGLSERLKHQPAQLSGGECQRVAIARALVNDPAMVLADEPTGNLDTKSGKEILKLFHELHRAGRTMVVVTHNLEIASELPRAVEFRDGKILSDNVRGVPKGED